jgi:hypothetical protein
VNSRNCRCHVPVHTFTHLPLCPSSLLSSKVTYYVVQTISAITDTMILSQDAGATIPALVPQKNKVPPPFPLLSSSNFHFLINFLVVFGISSLSLSEALSRTHAHTHLFPPPFFPLASFTHTYTHTYTHRRTQGAAALVFSKS